MLRVLIVDGLRAVRNQLSERLSFEGYTIDTVESIEECSKFGAESRYDVTLCDSAEVGQRLGIPFIVVAHNSSAQSSQTFPSSR